MKYMFYGCQNLTTLDLSNFNTNQVTEMENMFGKCINLKEIKGLDKFNTENVYNMKEMFNECKNLITLDIPNFITNRATDVSSMFKDCSGLQKLNISKFKLNEDCKQSKIFEGIDKQNCELITKNNNIRNLFAG